MTFKRFLPLIFLFVFSSSGAAIDDHAYVKPIKKVKSASSRKGAGGNAEDKEKKLLPDQQSGSVDLIQEIYRKRTKVGFVVGEIDGKTSERGESANFVVYLQSRPIADVTLNFKSENEVEGKVKPEKVVFSPDGWSERQTVTVIGQDDQIKDGEQTYDIVVSVSSEVDFEYARLEAKRITVKNKDNDKEGFIVSKISGPTSENGDGATFYISLNSQPTTPVFVYVYSSDESEGQVERQKVVFTEDDWNKKHPVKIVGQDDKVEDDARNYRIILDPAISDDKNYDGLRPSAVDVVNMDNDKVGVIASKAKGDTGEDGSWTSFEVRLRSEPIAKVDILVDSLNLDEGFVRTSILTFTPENWSKTQLVKVIGRDDSVEDGDRKYSVKLSPRSAGDPKYNRLKPVKVAVINKDNDKAGITVTKVVKKSSEMSVKAKFPKMEVGFAKGDFANIDGVKTKLSEMKGNAKFSVKLNTEPRHPVKIKLRSSDKTEGIIMLRDLIFTPEDWHIAKMVMIIGVDDELADGNQIYRIIIEPTESRDPKYQGIDPPDPNFVNLDNDSIGLTISDTKGKTSEDGEATSFSVCLDPFSAYCDTLPASETAYFTIRLDSKPKADVIVNLDSSDKGEGLPQPQSLTFTPDNWNQPQPVSVIGQPDQEVDGDQKYLIIPSVESEDTDYKKLKSRSVPVINIDKNGYGIFVGKVAGNTSEEGGSVALPVRLNSKPQDLVRIDIVTSDPGEGKVEPSQLTFDGVNWNQIQHVKIIGVDDDEQDATQDYYVTLNPDSDKDFRFKRAPSVKVDLSNSDDDEAGIIIDVVNGMADENGSVAKFAMRLSSQPTSSVVLIFKTDNNLESKILDYHAEFSPENWNKDRIIRARGLSDSKVDGDQIFHITSQGAVSKDPNYNQLPFNKVRLINKDLDIPKFIISDVSGDTDESGNKATFEVRLNSMPKYKVTLDYASDDKTEGKVKPNQLVFTTDNWNKEQKVDIIGLDDGYKDYDQDYKIIFAPSKSEDIDYQGVRSPSASVTNFDRKRLSAGLVYSHLLLLEALKEKVPSVGAYGLELGYMFTRHLELDAFILQAKGEASDIVYEFNARNPMEYTLDIMTLSLGGKYFLSKSLVDYYAKAGVDLYSWKLTNVNRLDDSSVAQSGMNIGVFGCLGFDVSAFELMVMSLEYSFNLAGDSLSTSRLTMVIKYPF